MSLPGVEVLVEKLFPKVVGRLGKEKPSSKRRRKDASVRSASTVRRQFRYNFHMLPVYVYK